MGMCKDASDTHCRAGCSASKSGVHSGGYFNDIFVYDSKTDTWGTATASSLAEPCLLPHGCGPYPMNNNVPQAAVRNDMIFTVGGEADPRRICGKEYGHYPT